MPGNKLKSKQCALKIKHLSRSSAQQHLDEKHGKDNPVFNVYLCSGCACYHVGHTPKSTTLRAV